MRRRRPFAILAFVVFAVLVVSSGPAAANPNYASIVVDGHTGRVIHQSNADAKRYPASMTKMMTLYIVFEELAAGRLSKSTPITFSKSAAARPPSKLGLKAGQTIGVDDAIRALVTKSANDVATAVAEHIEGTEWSFAKRMTETAHRIGMSRTTFRNASGLPDTKQTTTARDMATLARRLQTTFPQYYGYFSVAKFTWKGHTYSNHNKLLGRYKGTDGLKTGYIRASGYNLAASVKRGDKRVTAVVMGGKTGSRRDAHMRALLDAAFPKVAAYREQKPAPPPRAKPAPLLVAAATPAPAPALPAAHVARNRVLLTMAATPPRNRQLPLAETVDRPVDIAPFGVASRLADNAPIRQPDIGRALGIFPRAENGATTPTARAARRLAAAGPSGVAAFSGSAASEETEIASLIAAASGPGERVAVRGRLIRPANANASTAPTATAAVADRRPPKASDWRPEPEEIELPSGWHLQVGAYAKESQAEERLDVAKKAAKSLLADATAFAMPVAKKDGTIYRARFAGLDEAEAKRACSTLKRAKIDCFVTSQ